MKILTTEQSVTRRTEEVASIEAHIERYTRMGWVVVELDMWTNERVWQATHPLIEGTTHMFKVVDGTA